MEMHLLEKEFLSQKKIIIGVDEVGRGAIFGPLAIGFVIIRKPFNDCSIKDSKNMKYEQREEIFKKYKNKIEYIVTFAFSDKTLTTPLKEALNTGIKRALYKILLRGFMPVSGVFDKRYLKLKKPLKSVVFLMDFGLKLYLIDSYKKFLEVREFKQGDSKFLSIALASIFAKVTRDKYIESLDEKYPGYDLKNNKGYMSPKHRKGIIKQGVTELHRPFFRDVQRALQRRDLLRGIKINS